MSVRNIASFVKTCIEISLQCGLVRESIRARLLQALKKRVFSQVTPAGIF